MRNFLLTSFAVLLLLVPVLTSHIWNSWGGLAGPIGLLYCIIFLYSKKYFQPGWWRIPALYSSFLILAEAPHFYKALELSHESIRLLSIIWLVPIIVLVRQHFGSTIILILLSAISVLYAEWGIYQFVVQHDLGYQHLGETNISLELPAIAKFDTHLGKVIRAYGPYPHANIFGAVMVLGSIASLVVMLQKNQSIWIVPYGLLSLGLIVSFSRAAALAFILSTLVVLVSYRDSPQFSFTVKRLSLILVLITIMFIPLLHSRVTDSEDKAYSERRDGVRYAWNIINAMPPWRGVGLGQYPAELEKYLKENDIRYEPWHIAPVHAAPVLLFAEWGVGIGLILCGTLLWHIRYQASLGLLIALLPLFIFDHYLLTQTAPLVILITLLVPQQVKHLLRPKFPATR